MICFICLNVIIVIQKCKRDKNFKSKLVLDMQINFDKWNSPNRIKYYLNKLNSCRSVYQFVQCLSILLLTKEKSS